MNLNEQMTEVRELINQNLDELLPLPQGKEVRVMEAMRYSAIGTGKALRPFLAMSIGKILGLDQKIAMRIGVAIEMLHTYSLIHDDLPGMDDDNLRRGKPTNHIQFDEATAILAGDALQAKAFEVLLDPETSKDSNIRANLALELAKAAGASGMVGGQMLDLIGEKQVLTLEEVERMQSLKTGALLYFSCVAPAIALNTSKEILGALSQYASALGLMFQITDDILDVEGSTELVGKTLGKDSEDHKSTFVSILGLEKAKALALNLKERGLEALKVLGPKAKVLEEVLEFIITRKR